MSLYIVAQFVMENLNRNTCIKIKNACINIVEIAFKIFLNLYKNAFQWNANLNLILKMLLTFLKLYKTKKILNRLKKKNCLKSSAFSAQRNRKYIPNMILSM